MTNERVLVTGGAGFIAGWCIEVLLEQGYAVTATVRNDAGATALRSLFATRVKDPESLRIAFADLTSDEGWDEAMAGCRYVLHVASPLGGGGERPDALLTAARDGTLRVLRAAAAAGVARVVMTSAAAAARPPLDQQRTSDERVFADPDDPQFDAYRRSKILAETAAWDFQKATPDRLALTTILPGAVFGPVLSSRQSGSVDIIGGLLAGVPPALPKLGFWVVDVRDLAELHVRAMLAPAAGNERFLAAGEFVWMADIARILRAGLGPVAAKVPTREMPTWIARLVARFNPRLRAMVPLLGRALPIDTTKAREVLGFSPRPVSETLVECAKSLSRRI